MNLDSKNVIITGGVGGIGSATINMLLESVSNIGVIDNDKKKIDNFKKTLNKNQKKRIFFYNIDVGSFEHVEKVVSDFYNSHGSIDILINNAAILEDEPLVSIFKGRLKKHSLDSWNKTLSSNLNGYFYFTREVVEKMLLKRIKGVIINVSSISSSGNAGQTSYAASKAAVNSLTVTWANELSMFGIRVAGVSPGMTYTPMPMNSMSEQQVESWVSKTPLKRMATPEEIAEGIMFAIKNEYFCGRVLEIDGGLRM